MRNTQDLGTCLTFDWSCSWAHVCVWGGGWGQGDMLTTSFNIQIKKQTKKRVLKMQKDSKKAENNTSLPLPLKGSLKHLIGASLVVQ